MAVLIKITPEDVMNCSASLVSQHASLTSDQRSFDTLAAGAPDAWSGVAGDTFVENLAVLDLGFAAINEGLADLNAQLIATKDLLQDADSHSVWSGPSFVPQSEAGDGR